MDSVNTLHLTDPIVPSPLDCELDQKWKDGYRITSFMKVVSYYSLNSVVYDINF